MKFALLALLLWASALVSGAAAAESACRVPGVPHALRCGSVQRPLDPAAPQGLKIAVHYVVVPAKARHKQADPVMLLAGGPGQSAIELAPHAIGLMARLNNRRDVVLVDQRGTGRSAPLRCDEPVRESFAQAADADHQFAQLMRCKQTLAALPHVGSAEGLRHFSTPIAMQDLDAVRQQLGVAQLNLVGGSYGTRAALEYLRQFPHAVRRVVLDGVAPADMALPASMSRDGQAAFDALLASCEQEAACNKHHPSLRANWARLLASLPREVTLRTQRVTLTRSALLAAVRGPLYAPAIAAALPVAIDEAAHDRFEALVGLAGLLSSRQGGKLYTGMHFSVVCAEDVPRLAASTDAPGRDFGDASAQLYRRVCAQWPRGELPSAFYEIKPSPAPVLLLSGGLDPVTPPRHGERVAQALGAKARHVVLPNAGHGVLALPCMREVLHRFIDTDDDVQALKVDATCAAKLPRPPAFEAVDDGGAR